jgi:hypothetical protein
MKKVLLSALAIFTFGFAQAQDKKGGGDDSMKFGIKAGANFTNFSGDADTDGKTGFYVGALIDLSVAENFHVQPELLYSMEGADNENGISYIRIPIMAKYYIMEGLNLQAGPEIAFKAGTEDGTENAKSLDYGLGIGAAYEFPMGLFVDARYNLGLANISDDDNYKVNNTGMMVGLGYRF